MYFKFTALVYQISIYHYRFLQSVSYREFIRLMHGYLGRNKRIPLSACAYTAIRIALPVEAGKLTGYIKEAAIDSD